MKKKHSFRICLFCVVVVSSWWQGNMIVAQEIRELKDPVPGSNRINRSEGNGYFGWYPVIANAGGLSDSASLRKDSSMTAFADFVGNRFGKSTLKKVKNNLALQEKVHLIPNYLEGKLRSFYAAKDNLSLHIPRMDGLLRNKFSGAGTEAVYIAPSGERSMVMMNAYASHTAIVMDIPLDIQFAYNTAQSYHSLNNNLFKVGFDRDGYENILQKRMGKYYDLNKYFLNDMDVTSFAKNYFKSEVDGLAGKTKLTGKGDLFSSLKEKVSYEELMHLDRTQIEEKLMPPSKRAWMEERILAATNTLRDSSKLLLPIEKDSIRKQMNSDSEQLLASQNFVEEVAGLKKKLQDGGFDMNKFIRLQNAAGGDIKSYLNKPDVFSSSAQNLLPLNGLQKIFLKLKTLNAGSFGSNLSEKTVSDLFMNGMDLSALNNNNFFSAGAGVSRDGGYAKDAGLTSSVFRQTNAMQFLRFGKGDVNKSHTHLTVMNANTVNKMTNEFIGASLPRNIFAGTISKRMKISQSGEIEAELSKSSTQFRNQVSGSIDQVAQRKSAVAAFGEDLWQTISIGVSYSDRWENIGLTHRVHADYAGLGYNNPGNAFGARGTLHYGAQVKKDLAGRKLTMQVRTDIRNMNYSADGSSKWNNAQFQVDGRYKFNRKTSVALKANRYQMVRIDSLSKGVVYASNKLAAEAQSSYSIKGIVQRTNLSIGIQQFKNHYLGQAGSSDMLMTTWVQSMPVGNKMLTATLFYNKELRDQYLIGDLLNTDVTLGYQLKKNINLSTALTYLDNKFQARQIGIRQSIGTVVFSKVDVQLFVDYRKDMITPLNPYLFTNFRGQLSAFYILN